MVGSSRRGRRRAAGGVGEAWAAVKMLGVARARRRRRARVGREEVVRGIFGSGVGGDGMGGGGSCGKWRRGVGVGEGEGRGIEMRERRWGSEEGI
jgi:hypothetical protein